MDNKVSLIVEIIQSEIFIKDLLIFEHGLGRLVFIWKLKNGPSLESGIEIGQGVNILH